jgi:hypothetical protein
MNGNVYKILDDSEKRKLQFEKTNHEKFFKGDAPDGEHYILGLTEDGEVPWYRNEAYKYYYRLEALDEALNYIDEDRSYTIQLDKVEPDTEGNSKWLVTEKNDFHLRREVEQFIEEENNG